MSISTYLRTCQQVLKTLAGKNNLKSDITLVIGNESADLDSCVSSIAYGYLATIKAKHAGTIIPVLNLPREDIKLRAELTLLLKSVDIAQSDLICRDDLPSEARNPGQVSFVLLDHNHFKVEDFDATKVRVRAIIDHHVDERLYPDASPRIIRPCGSCTSLVVDHFRSAWEQDQIAGESQLTRLALSAILVDTSRLASQTTETDFNVVKFLRSRLMEIQDWDENRMFAGLRDAKRDIRGLSFAQLLRRDYKEWSLGPEVGSWGVSSITTSLDTLLSMSGWHDSLRSHCQARKLDVYILMTKHGEKELLIHVVNPEKQKFRDSFIELATTEMLLKQLRPKQISYPSITAYQQGELSATRKKVATICQMIKP